MILYWWQPQSFVLPTERTLWLMSRDTLTREDILINQPALFKALVLPGAVCFSTPWNQWNVSSTHQEPLISSVALTFPGKSFLWKWAEWREVWLRVFLRYSSSYGTFKQHPLFRWIVTIFSPACSFTEISVCPGILFSACVCIWELQNEALPLISFSFYFFFSPLSLLKISINLNDMKCSVQHPSINTEEKATSTINSLLGA